MYIGANPRSSLLGKHIYVCTACKSSPDWLKTTEDHSELVSLSLVQSFGEVFTLPHPFLPESSGIWWNKNMAESPANIAIPVGVAFQWNGWWNGHSSGTRTGMAQDWNATGIQWHTPPE